MREFTIHILIRADGSRVYANTIEELNEKIKNIEFEENEKLRVEWEKYRY